MHSTLLRSPWARAAALALLLAPFASAQSAAPRPEPYALKNVRLSVGGDEPTHTILVEHGRILAVQRASEQIPARMRVVDCEGLLALPAFVDAYGTAGVETPTPEAQKDDPAPESANAPIDMRQANRKGVQPAFRAADVYALSEADAKALRESGFGAHVAAPRGQLLAGTSALATTRDGAPRDLVVVGDLFQHATFSASGPGYPSTLMGYLAQLRQFFLDARRQRVLEERFEAARPGPRPPFDADLAAAQALLSGEALLVCETDSARDVERWVRLADEFGLRIAIAGGNEVHDAAALLVERDIPVFVTLDWGEEVKDPREKEKKEGEGARGRRGRRGGESPPDEPRVEEVEDVEEVPVVEEVEEVEPVDPEAPPEASEPTPEQEGEAPEGDASKAESEEDARWKYEEPFGVRLAKRLEWEERRDSVLRLHEAGVRVVFGTGGEKPDALLKNLRTLVANGYSKDAALAGLTSGAAELLGVDRHFGWLKPGHAAQVALWTKHPFEEGAQVRRLFVDGFAHEFEVKAEKTGAPDDGVDVSGTWDVDDPDEEEDRKFELVLSMSEDGMVSGSAVAESPIDGSELTSEVSGKVAGKEVTLRLVFQVADTQVDLVLEGEVKGDEIKGDQTIKFVGQEQESRFTAVRRPQRAGGTR